MWDDEDNEVGGRPSTPNQWANAGNPLVPWHMWGTSTTFNFVGTSGFSVNSVQLARVNYARPETWAFLFAAKLVNVPTPSSANLELAVYFDLVTGVGRSAVQIDSNNTSNGPDGSAPGTRTGFAKLAWIIAIAAVRDNEQKWTTVTRPPNLDETETTPFRPAIEHFPAQDIQCSARVVIGGGVEIAGAPFSIELHSYFAPLSHVRPEWFTSGSPGSKFRGAETGGT